VEYGSPAAGEVVAVKGGHVVDGAAVQRLPAEISNAAFQIAPDLYLAALRPEEYDDVMRDIHAGEELTLDYATFIVDVDFAMECHYGSRQCRAMMKGIDSIGSDPPLAHADITGVQVTGGRYSAATISFATAVRPREVEDLWIPRP